MLRIAREKVTFEKIEAPIVGHVPGTIQEVGGEIASFRAPGAHWRERISCKFDYETCPLNPKANHRRCDAPISPALWCGKAPEVQNYIELVTRPT